MDHETKIGAAERRLERSVDATLRVIAAACSEREAPPVHAARRHLGKIYGVKRLHKHLELQRRSA